MWPLEAKRDVVRVGRDQVERWAWNGTGLMLCGHQPMDRAAGPDATVLAEALRVLFETARDEQGAPGKPSREADVVLESAWLPVVLLEPGRTLWSRNQVEALLRHRLRQLHARRDEPVGGWELQLDHRAGDEHAVGFGLSPSVKQATMGATTAAGLTLASVQPALAWGWQRLKRHRRTIGASHGGWWVWIERDRSLVCRIERGRVIAMNAGAAVPRDEAQCLRLIEIEASRQGVLEQEGRGAVASWDRVASAVRVVDGEARLSWISVAASGVEPLQHRPVPLNAEAAA